MEEYQEGPSHSAAATEGSNCCAGTNDVILTRNIAALGTRLWSTLRRFTGSDNHDVH